MENKNELLEKLGFSQDYLKYININDENRIFTTFDNPVISIINKVNSKDLTSFVIEKSNAPLNKNFIYNEK